MLTKRIAAGLTAFVITASAALLPLPESLNGILGEHRYISSGLFCKRRRKNAVRFSDF